MNDLAFNNVALILGTYMDVDVPINFEEKSARNLFKISTKFNGIFLKLKIQ
jgi:hypothetical protein